MWRVVSPRTVLASTCGSFCSLVWRSTGTRRSAFTRMTPLFSLTIGPPLRGPTVSHRKGPVSLGQQRIFSLWDYRQRSFLVAPPSHHADRQMKRFVATPLPVVA